MPDHRQDAENIKQCPRCIELCAKDFPLEQVWKSHKLHFEGIDE